MADQYARSIDSSVKSPLYYQLYSILKEWITNGTYLPGAKLPPESQLCEVFKVSRITSHKAINLLVQEGLLTRLQGKGTYVSSHLERPTIKGDMEQMISKTIELAKNSKVQSVEIETITGDAETCEDLGIPQNDDVIYISFVRILNKERLDYREAFIPASLGLEFTKDEIREDPMYTLFERKGRPASTGQLLVGARSADPHLASLLKIPVGSPLLRCRLVVLGEDGQALQRSITHFRADRFEQYVFLTQLGDNKHRPATIF